MLTMYILQGVDAASRKKVAEALRTKKGNEVAFEAAMGVSLKVM